MKLYSILIIFFLLHLSAVSADTNGIWTYPRDITPGIFGEDESSNYSQNYTFNHPVIFNRNLTTNTLFDLDNPYYLVNPSGVSSLNSVVAGMYYSIDPNYFLNPQGESNLNFTDIYELHIQGIDINDMFVNVGEENSITGDMIVDETIGIDDLDSSVESYITSSLSNCAICDFTRGECQLFNSNNPLSLIDSSEIGIMCGEDEIDNFYAEHGPKWHQANRQDCNSFCSKRGRVNTADPVTGAKCTSGERRFNGIGISYVYGTWGGTRTTSSTFSVGEYCYSSDQKRDSDRTDRTVGCFC